jgi:hypothetical protein
MACDVWPTTRKYMLRDGFWNVQHYTDIIEALAAAFSNEMVKTNRPYRKQLSTGTALSEMSYNRS